MAGQSPQTAFPTGHDAHLTHPPRLHYGPYLTVRDKLLFALAQLVATVVSSALLILVVTWALLTRLVERFSFVWSVKELIIGPSSSPGPSPSSSTSSSSSMIDEESDKFEWDDPKRWRSERLVKDMAYYARNCGFDIKDETLTTDDGFYLRMHRVIDPQAPERNEKGGYPVLIMHGLFQSSGSFVTSEERSLAFWLAREGGYQVFLGNNRAVFGMGHKQFSRSDPRFWDWTVEELAMYDIPAMVEWICQETGYEQIAFIGHSQGNLQAFMALSKKFRPGIGRRLSYFAALAPALYAGPLTQALPFTVLQRLGPSEWGWLFGWLDYTPLMRISYDWTPASPYAWLGYQIFSYLFQWTDLNWLPRRKAKMFRFTPQPVSSASILWWTGKEGFSTRGCALDPDTSEPWWTETFPPLSIFSGGRDFLVLTRPVVDRIKQYEPHVDLLRWKRQPEAEHCDHYWASVAVEWVFYDLLDDIEKTRPPSKTKGEALAIFDSRR